MDIQTLLKLTKQQTGYERYGYSLFYDEFGAAQFIKDHVNCTFSTAVKSTDSSFRLNTFISLLWPSDPTVWKTHLAPVGAMNQSVLDGWTAPVAPYVLEEDRQHSVEDFTKDGI